MFGVRERYSVWICQEASTASFYWKIAIFAYLIMFQVIGILLAFQTRKVKLRGLRDSKYVAAIIYISSITIMLMALVTFTLGSFLNIGGGIFVVGISLLTTTFLVLIYIPKVSELKSKQCHNSFWDHRNTLIFKQLVQETS